MIGKIKGFLSGKKTHIIAAVQLAYSLYAGGITSEALMDVLLSGEFQQGALIAGAMSTIRAAIAKKA